MQMASIVLQERIFHRKFRLNCVEGGIKARNEARLTNIAIDHVSIKRRGLQRRDIN